MNTNKEFDENHTGFWGFCPPPKRCISKIAQQIADPLSKIKWSAGKKAYLIKNLKKTAPGFWI